MNIIRAEYLISSPSVDQCPKADRPEYAFIGRSNVGKSSLINMLCGKKALAKISATPGKTQLINYFSIDSTSTTKEWYIVDLPGYGYAKRSQKLRKGWSKMIEDYIRQRKSLSCVFVLIDSRHEPQKLDLDFINKMGEWQIPFAIVFTKSDKNKPAATLRNVNAFMEELQQHWEEPPVFFISSSITGEGREEILAHINELNNKIRR